jgi:hypothetical protein
MYQPFLKIKHANNNQHLAATRKPTAPLEERKVIM